MARLLVQLDARAGYPLQALPAPLHTSELSQAPAVRRDLRPGDPLVGDRALGSYAHPALCRGRWLHGLLRAHQCVIIDFRPRRPYAQPGARGSEVKGLPRPRRLRRLGRHGQLVGYHKPQQRPAWMSAAADAAWPASWVVRELRYDIPIPGRRTRVRFVGTGRWPKHARPGEDLPRLVVNPGRPGRVEPRVRERRPKEFPVMKRPRAELRQALLAQKVAA